MREWQRRGGLAVAVRGSKRRVRFTLGPLRNCCVVPIDLSLGPYYPIQSRKPPFDRDSAIWVTPIGFVLSDENHHPEADAGSAARNRFPVLKVVEMRCPSIPQSAEKDSWAFPLTSMIFCHIHLRAHQVTEGSDEGNSISHQAEHGSRQLRVWVKRHDNADSARSLPRARSVLRRLTASNKRTSPRA